MIITLPSFAATPKSAFWDRRLGLGGGTQAKQLSSRQLYYALTPAANPAPSRRPRREAVEVKMASKIPVERQFPSL